MGLVTNILGVIVGFAGLGACSLLRKLIIYNWPTSKIVTVELSGYAAELVLLRRLVMAEEGRLGIEEPGQDVVNEEELISEAERLTGARR
ncbi:hypothetical protein ACEPPN_009477 [Leptodophora sp. 'Broadleaf-Isolate-01']